MPDEVFGFTWRKRGGRGTGQLGFVLRDEIARGRDAGEEHQESDPGRGPAPRAVWKIGYFRESWNWVCVYRESAFF